MYGKNIMWYGFFPPQAILKNKKFKKIILNPPNFNPGSWCGAGKLWIDTENKEYWLTSRPRVGGELRGYAVEIYKSKNGENFKLVTYITKEELSEISGVKINSIENQQLLQDPLTNKYYLYLSLDIGERNIAGYEDKIYETKWETFLLSSEDPRGPWNVEGFVLRGDKEYDSGEARDLTIDIIDGRYFCLYKARKEGSTIVNTALAVSSDGKNWIKLGLLKINNKEQPDYFLLNGNIHASSNGPLFLGTVTTEIIGGAALTKKFTACIIDYRNLNLEEVITIKWEVKSKYEHLEYPIHTYSNIIYDPFKEKWIILIEAVDPTTSKGLGLNLEVDRVLLYETLISVM
ncbi:MAG: hypothetical protein QXI49_06205 [Candidatus Methanomethylicaceae archaeon]